MYAAIDGALIHSREELHKALFQALSLPEWYGRNLDALFDCLTDLAEETELRIQNAALLEERLGDYGETLVRVLQDAEEENPAFHAVLKESAPVLPGAESTADGAAMERAEDPGSAPSAPEDAPGLSGEPDWKDTAEETAALLRETLGEDTGGEGG